MIMPLRSMGRASPVMASVMRTAMPGTNWPTEPSFRAGMTGMWQVSARANATFREALDLDAAYARNWTLALDAKLLARTPSAVYRGRGATS